MIKVYNNAYYHGDLDKNKPHGYGYMYFFNDERYVGEFKYGSRNGKGAFFYKNGDIYRGDFINDLPNGRGAIKYTDGRIYYGNFNQGLKHGKGTLFLKDSIAVGTWKNDSFDGLFTIYTKNGECQNSIWKNGNLLHVFDKMDIETFFEEYKAGRIDACINRAPKKSELDKLFEKAQNEIQKE